MRKAPSHRWQVASSYRHTRPAPNTAGEQGRTNKKDVGHGQGATAGWPARLPHSPPGRTAGPAAYAPASPPRNARAADAWQADPPPIPHTRSHTHIPVKPRPRRHGHPAPGRTEHGAHASTEFQTGFVHRAVAGQDRAQPGPAGPDPGLKNATFRLPCFHPPYLRLNVRRQRCSILLHKLSWSHVWSPCVRKPCA